MPFAEFFELSISNNNGVNYVTNVALLSVPSAQAQAAYQFRLRKSGWRCNPTTPSLKQLSIPAGGRGNFFGPGTTLGIYSQHSLASG
jgi:hypothetical protein